MKNVNTAKSAQEPITRSSKATITQQLKDANLQERLESVLGFPVLVTVTEKINSPRYASATAIMKTARKQISTWTNAELQLSEQKIGIPGSPTSVTRLFADYKEREAKILEGDLDEQVDALIDILKG